MTIITPTPPMPIVQLPPGGWALTNVTPFTYRDGWTYERVLERMRYYLEFTLAPELDERFTGLDASWKAESAALIVAVETSIAEGQQMTAEQLADQAAIFNAQIQEIINSSITVQDSVVAGILEDPESESRIAIDALYANKGTQTTVETGRLTDANVTQKIKDIGDPRWYTLDSLVKNVKDHGAKGDGITDDTAAIQACLTAGGIVYAPPGRYLVSAELKVPSNTAFDGAGIGLTTLVMSGAADGALNVMTNARNDRLERTVYDTNLNLSDFTIDANARNRIWVGEGGPTMKGNGCGITFSTVSYSNIDRVEVINGFLHCIDIAASVYYNPGPTPTSYAPGPSKFVQVRDCIARNPHKDDAFTSHYSDDVDFINCVATRDVGTGSWTSQGFEIDEGCTRARVLSCTAVGFSCGFQAKGHEDTPPARDVVFRDCIAKACTVGVSLGDASSAGIIGRNYTVDNFLYVDAVIYDPVNSNELISVLVEGVSNATLTDITSKNCAAGGGIVIRRGASNVTLDGFVGEGILTAAGNAAVVQMTSNAGTTFTLRNIKVHGTISGAVVRSEVNQLPIIIDNVQATGTAGWAAIYIDTATRCVVSNLNLAGFANEVSVATGALAGTRTGGVGDYYARDVYARSQIKVGLSATPASILSGTGTPVGVASAPPGSMYLNTNGGAGATVWVKESGTGSAGWKALV